MKDGFIKVAAATPKIKVADPAYNTEEILKIIDETEKNGASILVFSELTISGYTCGDLFLQQPLLTECKNQLLRIVKATENKSMLVVVGCPIVIKQKLYNCAVVISDGSILGIVPKTHLPNYSEFYELRHFTSGEGLEEDLWFGEEFGYVNVAVNQLFKCKEIPELVVACEICEDRFRLACSRSFTVRRWRVLLLQRKSVKISGYHFHQAHITQWQEQR